MKKKTGSSESNRNESRKLSHVAIRSVSRQTFEVAESKFSAGLAPVREYNWQLLAGPSPYFGFPRIASGDSWKTVGYR